MYTLLLVDDEEEVIEAIVKKVKWEELGFQVTGQWTCLKKCSRMLL